MKSINLTPFICLLFLVIFICTGLWLYTQWDLKRFNESLPELPAVATPREDSVQSQSVLPQVPTASPESAGRDISQLETDLVRVENKKEEIAKSAIVDETQYAADASFDSVSRDFSDEAGPFDETEIDPLLAADAPEVNPELPYDIGIVKKGFDDYNASLATKPEYAYQRLDDALREQFGDDPDVDILVEHTRRSNNGTTTLDSEIRNLEAQLRLLLKNNYPGQQALENALHLYREMKQMSLEAGREIKVTSHVVIDTSRD